MDKNNLFKFEKKKKKRESYCPNCGKYGHFYKNCIEPITSYGIIIYKRVKKKVFSKNQNDKISNNKINNICKYNNIGKFNYKNYDPLRSINKFNENNNLEEDNIFKETKVFNENNELDEVEELIPNLKNNCTISYNYNRDDEEIYYLIVRRKDSLSFVEFIRGRYNLNDIEFIYRMFSEMTIQERDWIKNKPFYEIWKYLWKNDNNKNHKNEYEISSNKLNKIKTGYTSNDKFISLDVILNETKSIYIYPEWGFPKGRRNNREKDIETSEREFQEETGFRQGEYNIIRQLDSLSEIFVGSNNVHYKHIYFLAHCPFEKIPKINPNNFHQTSEIGDIGWLKFEDITKNYFRIYDIEKIDLLTQINNLLLKYKFSEENIMVI